MDIIPYLSHYINPIVPHSNGKSSIINTKDNEKATKSWKATENKNKNDNNKLQGDEAARAA